MDGRPSTPHPMTNQSDQCPICLESDISGTHVRLACNHVVCASCANSASAHGFEACPICRAPHLLDINQLSQRLADFRTEYSNWRRGAAAGATGEVDSLHHPSVSAKPRGRLGLHSNSAGDLAIAIGDEAAAPSAKPLFKPLGFAIVGMGRAGKIHLGVLQGRSDVTVRFLVDVCPSACPHSKGATITASLTDALADPLVDCVIVSTPTPSHADVIRAALNAGKHVFAEKPLGCAGPDVRALFALAADNGLLLHTAYNRRHDPAIRAARDAVHSGAKGKVLGATLVSRDYPYPPESYLVTSGNIFKDCVVHDLDYLTWLLEDEAVSLRANASTSGTERACGMWEYSEVHLGLRSGATATLINARVSDSYDHRLDVYCEKGVVRVVNPQENALGVAFSERFEASYSSQLADFVDGTRAVALGQPPKPNIDAERTLLLERLIAACERSVACDGARIDLLEPDDTPPAAAKAEATAEAADASADATPTASGAAPTPTLRVYDERTAQRVREHYRMMRSRQSVEHVLAMRAKYVGDGQLGSLRLSVWDAMERVSKLVDVSDPDLTLPNDVHAFQTAEGLRAAGQPEWLQLTGLIHDLGKMMYVRGCDEDGTSVAQQWSMVGDTWLVGCRMPDEVVFPEFNAASPDARRPERTSTLGIYEAGCGLDAALCAFGHDEYMYEVLRQTPGVKLPREALYVVRYHSLYPWHDRGCYEDIESDFDRAMKGWVKCFNAHDLYTKRNVRYSAKELAELRAYYSTLVDKFLPDSLHW